ncbi:MAG: tetratricopeptide repeat protein [Acidobacteria bacterium]|nr:tetratricopeptide repeat protein [Acidobacteriota bacterium]
MDKLLISEYRVEQTDDIAQVLDSARVAELRRDSVALREILEPFWPNLENEPALASDDLLLKGEFFRICGLFLSAFGHSRGIGNYQERGKDLLSKAITCFETENCLHKINETKVSLASMYYYEGRVDECEAILEEAGSHYERNQLHPVYLSICINKIGVLHWKRDYTKALEIIEAIEIPMSVCDDPYLKGQFHNQAGIIYTRSGNWDTGQLHYKDAINYASEVGSERHVGLYLNNLAFSCSSSGKFDEAEEYAEQAHRIFSDLNELNWLAMTLDTLAQVHLHQNKLELATERIDRSAELFQKAESFGELTDALWVKVLIFLKADNKEEAFMQFADLCEIAKREIGEYAVRKYSKQFASIAHIVFGTDYHLEVKTFKRKLLMESIVESNADLNSAAERLHTTRRDLVNILNREFPEIYLELGISTQVMSSANH